MRLMAIQNRTETTVGLLDQMHALRARVFHQRMGWDVSIIDGREVDAFDLLNPTYILVVDQSGGQVIGCARLLPGTGPTMLGRTFPFLLNGNAAPRGAQVVESSRFCVDTTRIGSERARGVHQATMLLFGGILNWAKTHGHSNVITVTDLRFERILKRAGLPFGRLGVPRPIGDTVAIAGMIPATDAAISSVQAAGSSPVLTHEVAA